MEFSNIKILVIDDNPDNLITIRALIQEAFDKAIVLTAQTGKKGIAEAEAHDPDVILLDIVMPEIDGFETCRLLKANPLTSNIPVVFLTALKGDRENRIRAIEAGAEGFLSKPVDETELFAQIRAMAKIKAASKQKQDEANRLQRLVEEKTKALQHELEMRKSSEEAMATEKQKFEKLIETLPISLSIVTLEGQILYQNPKCRQLFEINEELPDEKMQALIYWVNPDDRTRWLNEISTQGYVQNFTMHVKTLTGKEIWALGSGLFISYNNQTCVLSTHLDITEQKIAEDKLKISDRIFSHSIDMLCLAGFDGYFKVLNPAWSKTLGWTTEELLSQPWNDFVHPDDLEDTNKAKSSITDGYELYAFENRYRCKDGSYKWLSWRSFPYADERIMFGVARDITQQRNTEREYETLFNEMLDGFALHEMIFDAQGNPADYRYIKVNPAFEAFTGLKVADIVGKTVLEVLPGIEKYWIETYGKVVTTGQPFQFENFSRNLNRYFEVKAFSPAANQFATIFSDITERKITELTLQEERQRLAGIIEGTNSGTWEWNAQTGELIINERWAEMIGYSTDELQPISIQTWIEHAHPDDLKVSNDLLDRHFKGALDYYEFETRMKHKNGDWIWVLDRGKVVTHTPDGKPLMIMGTHQDITERKQMQLSLEESEMRIRTISENLPGFFYQLQHFPEGNVRFNYVSQGINHFGFTPEEVLQDAYKWASRIHPDDLQRITDQTFDDLKMRSSWHEQFRFLHPEGRTIWVEGHDVPRSEPDGSYIFNGFFFDITDRKKAETELKERETRLQKIFEILPIGLWFADKDGKLLKGNPAGIKIWGAEPKVPISEYGVFKAWRLPERTPVLADDWALARTIREGITITDELIEIEAFDGKRRIILNYTAPITDENGLLQGAIVVNNDITDRILSEEKLRINEERLAFSLQATNDGLWDWNLETNEAYFSPQYYRMLGYEPDEFPANFENWRKLLHEDDLPKCEQIINKSIIGGIGFEIEFRCKTRDGDWKWILGRGKVVEYNPAGKPLRMVGTHQDITERKQMLEEIRQSEERFRALHNASFGGIAVHDKGLILMCNQGMAEMTGYKPDELIGMNGLLLIAEDKRDDVIQNIAIGYEEPYESVCQKKDGTLLPIRIESRNIPYKDKKVRVTEFRDISEQKKYLKEIQEKEERWRKIIKTSPDGIVITSMDGTLLEVSDTAYRMFGYSSPAEVVGKNILDFIDESDKQKSATAIRAMLRGTFTNITEYQVLKKDGTRFFVEIKAELLRDNNGKPVNMIFVERDITERKAALDKIKESEERFRLLVKNSSDITVMINEDGSQRYVSPAAKRITGYDPEELTGKFISEVIHPDDMTEVSRVWDELISTPQNTVTVQYRHIHKTKGWVYLEALGQNFLFEPAVNAIVSNVRDITESKHLELIHEIQYNIARSMLVAEDVESLLEIIRNELSKMFDTTNFFVALYNPQTDMLRKVIFKDEKDSFIEWPADKSISGYVVKSGKTVFMKTADIQEYAQKNNIELLGTTALIWLGVPITIHNKVLGAMVIQSYNDSEAYTAADIALLEMVAHETGVFFERKQTLEDLIHAKVRAEESDRLKGSFINLISHEIRTPMTGIVGFGEFLMDENNSQEERRAHYIQVKQSANRLMNTVTDYVDIARIVSKTIQPNPKKFRFRDVVKETLAEYKNYSEAKGIEFTASIPDDPEGFIIQSDKEFVVKIIKKLADNAVKFTSEGSINAGYTVRDGNIEFFVKDTGIGISETRVKDLFKVFVQEDSAITRKYEGSGLGLAIAKGFAELLGGKIRFETVSGKGSAFWFDLPVGKSTTQVEPTTYRKKKISESVKPLVLIAEDDESNFTYIQMIIRRAGCDVLHAERGEEAVELCRQNPDIAFVIMDIKMPGMTGTEALKMIRKFRPHLPIVALTAYAQTGDEFELLKSGFTEYHAKPVKPGVLTGLIRKFIERV